MTSPQTDRSPLPLPDAGSAPHWDGLARGALVLRRCDLCEALNHPIAVGCRLCGSDQLSWTDVDPAVRLFSWTVEGRAVIEGMSPPYVVVQVTPAECEDGAVRLIGNYLGDPDRLEIGMGLVLEPLVIPSSDVTIAMYVPA